MPLAKTNAIEIDYEDRGDPAGPVLLLVHGLGAQRTAWPERFLEMFVSRGYRVVTFDNRDIGLSSWFDDAGMPDLLGIFGGRPVEVPYLLDDMADDAVGLLEALEIPAAHVAGVSMGGMIAQTVALRHQERVLSLCSVMSTPDAREVGRPTAEAMTALMKAPGRTRDEYIEQSIASLRVIGSPGYPFDEEQERHRAGALFDRSFHPEGTARQLAAILCSKDRRPGLAGVHVPTLVIHGTADPLVQPDGGRATAEAIAGAKLEMIEGMGHDLPEALWQRLVEMIDSNAETAAPVR